MPAETNAKDIGLETFTGEDISAEILECFWSEISNDLFGDLQGWK